MSSSIAIPTGPSSAMEYDRRTPRQASEASASSPSSYSSSPSTPEPGSKAAQKRKVSHQRRESLLSPEFTKEECTTINIGDDGQPRLISYLSSSQGFLWNPEVFIPSYMDYEYTPLEHQREPVIEIVLSDEEIKKMLPQ
ncbi:hypothetical protein NKR19_g726 [Coniochaeta hoffmannii]|uniref:Uncharacterized protein n=1 Tax=Coniochaeta hoffmannii TaxID=91930 RepID=A0AA38W3Y6_9PEZI|nr:hypothetical protein NKR19_g726 [Coniochaeta hoffmannii]